MKRILLPIFLLLAPAALASDEAPSDSAWVTYDDGLHVRSGDGNYHLHLEFRLQFRWSSTDFDDESAPGAELPDRVGTFGVNRARLRAGGHAYRPWLRYYLEYDLVNARLLDGRFTAGSGAASGRVGRWKVEFTRERRASSREQQLVDRSIVNPWFTVDRQEGLMGLGALFEESAAELRWYAGVFNGTGAGRDNDDSHWMWFGRLQWNSFGRDPGFAQSDPGLRAEPAFGVAVAGILDRSPYTAFSGAGGSQLPGFDEGESGRYDLRQVMGDVVFKHRGSSFQGEIHWKRIDDRETGVRTDLRGGYFQAGTFPGAWLGGVPRALEVAARAALVDPDDALPDDVRTEYTLGANWYFHGHANKLSADIGFLRDESGTEPDQVRGRLQWDVTF